MWRDSVGTSADNPVRSAAHGIHSLIVLIPKELQYWKADNFSCQKSEDHLSQQMQAQLLSSQGGSWAWEASVFLHLWKMQAEKDQTAEGLVWLFSSEPTSVSSTGLPFPRTLQSAGSPTEISGAEALAWWAKAEGVQRSCEISPWSVKKSNRWGAEESDFSWPFFEKDPEPGGLQSSFPASIILCFCPPWGIVVPKF